MKKFTLIGAALALASFGALAQGSIQFTTNAPVGTVVKLLPNTTSALQPITIDYGNGVEVPYTVDPSMMAYQRWIEGTVEGNYITIKGNLTELSFTEAQLATCTVTNMVNLSVLTLRENELESFELATPCPIKTLDLSHNKIANSPTINPTLSLEYAGGSLTNLNLSYNEGLQCLDMRNLTELEYLTANDCPDFASLFICMPEASHPRLRSINLENCSLSNFYPVTLPNLRTLNLGNNRLMTEATDNPFTMGNYPNLTTLNINGNQQVAYVDVTKTPLLESLYINDCRFEMVDVSQCPELRTLNAARNRIRSLDLGNNKNLTSIYINDNPISELDVTQFSNITNLNISNTLISRVNLLNAYYLKEFVASNTLLEFIDFNGMQPGRMTKIDLRDNPNFTYESMAYTVKTLPVARDSHSSNVTLFLSGSNAEKSDIEFATSYDMHWVCDIEGDGSARHTPLNVTLQDATDTGENKTGVLDRLYPLMGYSMPYDLDVMETNGGKFILCQWQPEWFQTMASVHDLALKGVPMYVYAYPEEGKRFKSVTVNGEEIKSPWFIVSEDANIKVNFSGEEPSIAFDVLPGHEFTFLVNTVSNNGSVWVDWGTGTRTEYPGQRAYADGTIRIGGERIDGTTASDRVTIYGDIAAIDVSGFGDVAADFGLWDNHILGADLSNCSDLKYFNCYWNPISSLDLSNNTNLSILNISYTNLSNIDLSNNAKLLYIEAYSDGWGEDGIAQLESIDVSGCPYLQYLDVKNNLLQNIDLSNNTRLRSLQIRGNELTSLDVSHNTLLETLNCGANHISAIDLSNNTELIDLNVDDNDLTSLDVANNTKLESLSVANCKITALDTHNLADLKKLWINGNGLTAPQLNEIYYLLPTRKATEEDENGGLSSYNLYVIQGLDKVENEGLRADSSIAVYRNWDPSHKGNNGGCDWAYLDIFTPIHGSVVVTDENGNVYTNGSKVPKYIPLTIVPTPETGYRFASYSLNGEGIFEGSAFNMPGIFTRLSSTFTKDDGVDGVYADGSSVRPVQGGILLAATDAEANIYNVAGVCMASNVKVDGDTFVALEKGMYIVRLKAGTAIHSVSVLVK